MNRTKQIRNLKKNADSIPVIAAPEPKLPAATIATGASTININVIIPAAAGFLTPPATTTTASAVAMPTLKAACAYISIKNEQEVVIKPLITTTTPGTEHEDRSVPFKIILDSGYKPKADTTIKIKLVAVNSSASKPELLTAFYPIKQSDWPTDKKPKELSFTTFIRLNNIDSLGDDKLSYLTLDGCMDDAEKRQVVRESSQNLYNPNKPFWVEAGYNFDLLDDIKTSNIFYGVFLYKRDIRRIFLKPRKFITNSVTKITDTITRSPNLGLFGGFYNSRSTSEETSTSFSPLVYFDPNQTLRPVSPAQPDVYRAFADSGKVKVTSSVRNVGLFFSPQVRLTRGTANSDGLHAFVSLWLELIWQRYNTNYDFSETKRYDTFNVRVNTDSFRAVGFRPSNESSDVRSHYYGIGMPLYLKEGTLNLYFSPIIGVTNQKLAIQDNITKVQSFKNPFVPAVQPDNLTTKTIKSVLSVSETPRWNFFYLFQFRLNEEKYGLAFTGEVRGLIKKEYKPIVSLAISKKFDLDKLLTFGLAK